MAVVKIEQVPGLTPEAAQEVFAREFQGRCEVYTTKIRTRDFIVKESGWTGVGVKVAQEDEATKFVFSAMMPNLILQALFGGLIAYLFLRPKWKALEEQVEQCIRTAPEFQPTQGKKKNAA